MKSFRQRSYHVLEHGFDGSLLSKLCSGFIVVLIVMNVVAVIAESHEPLGQKYEQAFFIFNLLSVIIFTIEYIARVWVSIESTEYDANRPFHSRVKYIFSSVALIDLIAIAPFYLSFFFAIDLRYLRMLRMLRLLKLTHYFKGLRLFIGVLKEELSNIAAAMFIMLVLILLSASLMYSVEHSAQPEVFDSIPTAIWWSVVTMTTVGYGDVLPITPLGKLVAMFIMLLGVGLVALPAAMLAAKFGDELRSRKRELESQLEVALSDDTITPEELDSLIRLSDQLELPDSTLEHLIQLKHVHKNAKYTCPKCGHEYSEVRPTELS